jgi:hypothetical protein
MATVNTAGYASDVVVGSALPQEMNYQLPASLPAAKNFEIRVQPVNAQSFTSGNVVQIDIPCGRPGQYLDPTTTYIRFKAVFTHGGTAATDYSRLIGSPYSFFIKQECYGNNSVLLESINEVGVLASTLVNLQLNDSDKRGLSPCMGFEYATGTAYYSGSTAGHFINKTAAGAGVLDALTFEYAIPLIGLLGSGTNKMIPIGEVYGLRFELTMDDYTKFTKFYAGTNTNIVSGCTISEFEFVGNVIELSPEANALIQAQNPDKIRIRSQTYRQSSNTLAASTGAGTNDLLVGIRVSSLKSIYMVCSPSDAAEGKYAGVNPNLDQGTSYIIGGAQYPQRCLAPSAHPADAFMETQKALGALGFSVFNGTVSKNAWYKSSTAYQLCTAYNATAGTSIMSSPNQFFLGVDTEVVARKDNLLSGINVNSSPMFFRAQVGSALSANTHTLNFFGYYDVILEIDRAQKNIVAKF